MQKIQSLIKIHYLRLSYYLGTLINLKVIFQRLSMMIRYRMVEHVQLDLGDHQRYKLKLLNQNVSLLHLHNSLHRYNSRPNRFSSSKWLNLLNLREIDPLFRVVNLLNYHSRLMYKKIWLFSKEFSKWKIDY
jgi:hypothetical protein